MTVFVFGNEDFAFDSLPLKVLPQLRKEFSDTTFTVLDPNEEWEVPENMIIIDTVQGIKEVTVFSGLDQFSRTPNLTMHDFDALSNLRYLQKLGKIKKVTVIGVPDMLTQDNATMEIRTVLKKLPH